MKYNYTITITINEQKHEPQFAFLIVRIHLYYLSMTT